jgi:hypothetical protein
MKHSIMLSIFMIFSLLYINGILPEKYKTDLWLDEVRIFCLKIDKNFQNYILFSKYNMETSNKEIKLVEYSQKIYPSKKANNFIGQIGGISFEKNGNLLVFHRGNRMWTYR